MLQVTDSVAPGDVGPAGSPTRMTAGPAIVDVMDKASTPRVADPPVGDERVQDDVSDGHSGRVHPDPTLHVIAHVRDVDGLLAGALRRRGPAWVIAGLPSTEAADRSRRLAELRAECGCGTGAACAMSTLVLCVPWLVVTPMPSLLSVVGHILTAMGLVIVTGGLGKAFGITRARRLLRRELTDLRNRLAAM